MQNKNNKNQLQKELRQMHERIGALVIVGSLVAGSIAVSQEARRTLGGLVMHPAFAVVEHSTKDPEVAHRHMRVESDGRAALVSGQ